MDPNAEGSLYCSEQIKIPAQLPDVLREFTKAAIRTQPPDLLKWAAAYFEALNLGETPPVKSRLEESTLSGGLSKGGLAVLHRQLGDQENVLASLVRGKWEKVGYDVSKLNSLLEIGGMTGENVEWEKLLALACTALEKTLASAVRVLCEILSSDLEGGPARIDVGVFENLYGFLAGVDGEVSERHVASVMEFLNKESERFDGKVGPKEFLHKLCPNLDARPLS